MQDADSASRPRPPVAAHRPGRPLDRRGLLRAGVAAPLALVVPAGLGRSSWWSPAPVGSRPTRSADEWSDGLDEALRGLVGGHDDPAGGSVGALGSVGRRAGRWRGAAGYADRDRRRPARRGVDYQFRAGSVSKAFTATVVLQLVGEGRLHLDEPVGRRLPGLVPGEDRITVRHLLSMTSGLADYVPLLFPSMAELQALYREYREATSRPLAPRWLVGQAAAQGLVFEPGTRFQYSTTNYLVLGLLVEQATDRRLRDELHRRILRPLGLRRTDLPDGPGLQEPYLRGYAHFDDRSEPWVDVSIRYEHGWAGGGLVSTLTDLTRFFSALLGGELLRSELLAAMTTPSDAPSASPAPPGAPSGQTYGLGLCRDDRPACGPMWGHGGDTHGYNVRAVTTTDARGHVLAVKTGYPTPVPELDNGFQPFTETAFDALCT